jgi:hypothetical protein
VLLLVAATCWSLAPRGPQRWRLRALALAWLATPVVVGAVCLLTFNKLRFDAWFDFGRHYQLSWISFGASKSFVLANAWSYTLRPFALGCAFPFLHAIADMGSRALPSWLHRPDGYIVFEPVVGCLLAIPWAWLAPVAIGAGIRRTWALVRGHGDAGAPAVALTWLAVAATIASAASFIVPLSLFWATMRFLGDATPALTLLGTLGWWLCYQRFRERGALRRLIAAGALLVALATVSTGVALGFEGQYKHFRQHNPALLERLEKHLSFC